MAVNGSDFLSVLIMRRSITFLFCFFICLSGGFAQLSTIRQDIELVVRLKNARVGVAVLNFNDQDTLTLNNEFEYPMQSVYKFHLALAVLNEVDEGKLSLEQDVFIKKSDLLPDTYSPLRDKYPDGNISIPLHELLEYTVSKSDNNGCDILFRLVGGTEKVHQYINGLHCEVAIVATEEEMHQDWETQYRNCTKPFSAVKLLSAFFQKNILSEGSHDFLWKIMVGTTTGSNKIKGLLPDSAIVGHKTGSSARNKDGLKAAENDIGIVELPDGSRFAIAAFVSNSMENDDTNAKIIAEITKIIWDYYNGES